jgi:hypothetical protein
MMVWVSLVEGLLILAFFAPMAAALMNVFLFVEQTLTVRGLSPADRRAASRRCGKRLLLCALGFVIANAVIHVAAPPLLSPSTRL